MSGDSTKPLFYEPLAAHHDRAGFDCGEGSLNKFLQKRARQNAERNLGVTHVAVADAGATAILGYYTLLVRSIEREDFAGAKKLPPGEIGVALLARLAVSVEAQGRGLGTQMLLRAIVQTSGPHAIWAFMLWWFMPSTSGRKFGIWDWILALNY